LESVGRSGAAADIGPFKTTAIKIAAPLEKVFKALTENVASWWGIPYL
jgi:hypothetical protein